MKVEITREPKLGKIDHLFILIAEDSESLEIAESLLGAVEELCRARGVSYVEVQTDSQAAPFYEASGYETEADVRVLSRSYAL